MDIEDVGRQRAAALHLALGRLSVDASFAVEVENLADLVWPQTRRADGFPGSVDEWGATLTQPVPAAR